MRCRVCGSWFWQDHETLLHELAEMSRCLPYTFFDWEVDSESLR